MSNTSAGTGSPALSDERARGDGEIKGLSKASATTTPQPAMSTADSSTMAATASHFVGSGNRSVSSSTPSRAPYVPQFSAATQMILKRMRGETGGLASALASATASGAPRLEFTPENYESARKQIVANLSTGKNSIASPKSSPSSSKTPVTLTLPASSTSKFSSETTLSLSSQKRKRGRNDDSDASSPAEASDYGEGIKKKTFRVSTSNMPTTTKSGRHILKPDTYDPAAEDNIRKRNQLGKRTTEQALCKKCTRMHSPVTNQMVFCDGCNDPWHQRCHDPWIEDEVVKNPAVSWYCAGCAAKRERLQPKKKVVVQQQQPILGPWPDKGSREVFELQ